MSKPEPPYSPLVSIVIPAYNAEEFIDRTLVAAIQQSYQPVEVIVVDDGSTDSTASRVARHAACDSRIRLISIRNGGVARARNIGTAAACGTFVAFLDADDLWHPNKIRLQMDCMVQSPVWLGGCYTLTRSIDRDDRVITDGPRLVADGYVLARQSALHLVRNGSCLLVRREVALSLGGYDPSYADRQIGGCEDLEFEFKLAARYLVGVIPHYLVGYRQWQGNMSSDRIRMSRALRATVATHLARNPSLPCRVRRIARAKVYEHHIWNYLRERRLAASLLALIKLAPLDILLTGRILGEIGVASARHFGLIRKSLKQEPPRPLFHELSMEPYSAPRRRDVRDVSLADELAAIDARLWMIVSASSAAPVRPTSGAAVAAKTNA